MKKPSDFVKAQKFRAAGLGVSSSKDVRFRLSFDILGLKYDYVTGYNNSSDARLAVQRAEAQYHDETLPSYRTQVEPQMVKTGMVVPIYYTDLVAPSGEILVSRDVPELQPFTFYYKEVFGKPPSGIKYEALKAANMSSTNMTRMHGRCPQGERLVMDVPHGHWKTTTFVAALRVDGLTAPTVVDGPMILRVTSQPPVRRTERARRMVAKSFAGEVRPIATSRS